MYTYTRNTPLVLPSRLGYTNTYPVYFTYTVRCIGAHPPLLRSGSESQVTYSNLVTNVSAFIVISHYPA